MNGKLSKQLMEQADLGLFYLYASISMRTVIELRKAGFSVTDSHESTKFPRVHRIYWKHAGDYVFDYDNVHNLDENNPSYSLVQRLWIISEKNQPSLKFLYG